MINTFERFHMALNSSGRNENNNKKTFKFSEISFILNNTYDRRYGMT